MAEPKQPLDSDDRARHTELSIRKATGGLSQAEEDELTKLRNKRALNNAVAGNDY